MKRLDFLRATLLAPLVAMLPKPIRPHYHNADSWTTVTTHGPGAPVVWIKANQRALDRAIFAPNLFRRP